MRRNGSAVDFGVRTFVPHNGQLSQRIFGAPPCISHHSHRGGIHTHHRLNAAQSFDFAVVKADQLASKNGTVHDGSAQHAVQFDVNAVG